MPNDDTGQHERIARRGREYGNESQYPAGQNSEQ